MIKTLLQTYAGLALRCVQTTCAQIFRSQSIEELEEGTFLRGFHIPETF